MKYFLSMAGPDVISVGACGEAQRVLKRVEREASHRYQTLTLPEDGAAHCMYVNGRLIHRNKLEAPKSDAVSRAEPLYSLKCCSKGPPSPLFRYFPLKSTTDAFPFSCPSSAGRKCSALCPRSSFWYGFELFSLNDLKEDAQRPITKVTVRV